jgi:hypothetical protein
MMNCVGDKQLEQSMKMKKADAARLGDPFGMNRSHRAHEDASLQFIS